MFAKYRDALIFHNESEHHLNTSGKLLVFHQLSHHLQSIIETVGEFDLKLIESMHQSFSLHYKQAS